MAMKKKESTTREYSSPYTFTLRGALAREIREVADSVGLPQRVVRSVVTKAAEKALDAMQGNVLRAVAEHFHHVAEAAEPKEVP